MSMRCRLPAASRSISQCPASRAMSLSSHKIGGPKGIGALLIRDRVDLTPFIRGGGQERRRRGGTENVAAIAGFGAASAEALASLAHFAEIAALRDRLEAGVRAVTPEAVIIGTDAPRLGNTSTIALPGKAAENLVIRLDLAGIAVSAGAACSSGKVGASHVLASMGLAPRLPEVRFGSASGPVRRRKTSRRFSPPGNRSRGRRSPHEWPRQ